MSTTRREFLEVATAAAGVAALSPIGLSRTPWLRHKSVLILGGTGFIGPHIVRALLEGGGLYVESPTS